MKLLLKMMHRSSWRFSATSLGLFFGLIAMMGNGVTRRTIAGEGISHESGLEVRHARPMHKKINMVFNRGESRTLNPEGWEEYEGSAYNADRGYGWLAGLGLEGSDHGPNARIMLADGTQSSPQGLGRLELANSQGRHPDNLPLVFRIDLPDGWYRVSCTSVAPGIRPLPLGDQRTFKCRAHDVVFAGGDVGAPLVVTGDQLVEGTGRVEVTDGHLRVVVGDPAYGGWTWAYRGPWYRGWGSWWRWKHKFANGWYQKLTRTADPGFHSSRLNSLEIERVEPPPTRSSLFFRDFFNRDDSSDVNSGVPAAEHWDAIWLDPSRPGNVRTDLYKTSIRIASPKNVSSTVGLIQPKVSPPSGVVRYSTRVSLFTGAGSRVHGGFQEAGLLILAEPEGPTEFTSAFIGVAFDSGRTETPGWIKYRVGNGSDGYRTDIEIPDTSLSFKVREGEYEILVDHDVENNLLKQVRVNGVDMTTFLSLPSRKQRISRGFFGIRASMDAQGSGVNLQQFYWYYRVEFPRQSISLTG